MNWVKANLDRKLFDLVYVFQKVGRNRLVDKNEKQTALIKVKVMEKLQYILSDFFRFPYCKMQQTCNMPSKLFASSSSGLFPFLIIIPKILATTERPLFTHTTLRFINFPNTSSETMINHRVIEVNE